MARDGSEVVAYKRVHGMPIVGATGFVLSYPAILDLIA